MLSLLVTLTLSIDAPQLPDADLRDALVPVEELSEERRHAVWLQPIGLTVGPLVTTAAKVGTYLAVPLGATLDFEFFQLNVEVTGYGYGSSGSAFVGGFASVGPTFHTGDKPLNGFFVSPKLGFDVLHELTRNRTGAAFMLGFDAGWQKTFGRLYLALMLGVSGGWSFADSDFIEGPGFTGPVGFGVDRARPVLGVNVNLLRLGFAL